MISLNQLQNRLYFKSLLIVQTFAICRKFPTFIVIIPAAKIRNEVATFHADS